MPGPEDYMNYGNSEVFAMEENKDVEGLIGVLKYNKNKHVVKRAIFALGEMKDKKAVEPLIKVGLKSGLITIRSAAIRALGDIESNEAVESLIYVMLRDKDNLDSAEAARALGRIKDGRAVKSLTMLMQDVEEGLNVREEIVEALGKIATEEAIHSLIAALDSELGEKALKVLKDVGKPAVMPLITALNGDNETIMWKAATILGEIRDKRAVEPLVGLLLDESKDEWDRGYYIAAALGSIGDARAVEPLIKLASKHIEDQLTCRSVGALGDIGDHKAVEPLIDILEDRATIDCSHLRLETCWALRKLKDAKTVEPLIKIVEGRTQGDWVIKGAAAYALVELDDDRIELPLLKYFKTELEARVKSENLEHQEDEALKAVVKLIARLIDKS